MKKAICILRISTLRQEIEYQRNDMENYTGSFGFKKDEILWITGEGASAFKIDESYKEQINTMFNAIENDSNIKTVFAWHINRLGRDEEELQKIRKFLVSHKVQLRIKEPTLYLLNDDGTENPGMSLAFSMFATMSRQQIEEFRAKTARTKRILRQEHKYTGGFIAYGYGVEKGEFYIKEDEATIIKKIFDMYVNEGISTLRISKELLESGYLWHNSIESARLFVYNLVRNPIYCGGNSIDSKQGHKKGTTLKYGAIYKPIISKELFEKAEVFNNVVDSKKKPRQTNNIYFAKGIIKMTDGRILKGIKHSAYYKTVDKPTVCININMVDSLIWYHCLHCLKNGTKVDVARKKRELIAKIQLNTRKIATCHKNIHKFEQEIERIEERLIIGRITSSKADELENERHKQILILKNEIDSYYKENYNIDDQLSSLSVNNVNESYDKINNDKDRYELIKKFNFDVTVEQISQYVFNVAIDGVMYKVLTNWATRKIMKNGEYINFEYLDRYNRK